MVGREGEEIGRERERKRAKLLFYKYGVPNLKLPTITLIPYMTNISNLIFGNLDSL